MSLDEQADDSSAPKFSRKLNPRIMEEAEAIFLSRVAQSGRKLNWVQSALTGVPVDQKGDPCPWYTFPMLHFLRTRDLENLSIFEFGSGNSTAWWAKNSRVVTSVEHSKGWFDRMQPQLPKNVTYIFRELEYGGDYSREIRNHFPTDIVVIDGRDRVNCAKNCIGHLPPESVIIWDNSNRSRYNEGYAALVENGYRRIDFWGHGPVNAAPWMSSVFYKPQNCLEI